VDNRFAASLRGPAEAGTSAARRPIAWYGEKETYLGAGINFKHAWREIDVNIPDARDHGLRLLGILATIHTLTPMLA
jgi:hypothetical protein